MGHATILIVVTALSVTLSETVAPAVQRTPPVDVVFSAPAEGEADVRLDSAIRIQFSRHVDERSLVSRVRLRYSAVESAERGEAQPPDLRFDVKYDSGVYAMTITPTQRLERFREVHVDLLEGIVASDGSPLKPWRLRFKTGGSDNR